MTYYTTPINRHMSAEHEDLFLDGYRFATAKVRPQTGIPMVDYSHLHLTKEGADEFLIVLEKTGHEVDHHYDEHEGTFEYAWNTANGLRADVY